MAPVTTAPDEVLPAVPDLTDAALDDLAGGGTVLAAAVRCYRARLGEDSVPPVAFNAGV